MIPLVLSTRLIIFIPKLNMVTLSENSAECSSTTPHLESREHFGSNIVSSTNNNNNEREFNSAATVVATSSTVTVPPPPPPPLVGKALKKYEQFIQNTSCFCTMCDFQKCKKALFAFSKMAKTQFLHQKKV